MNFMFTLIMMISIILLIMGLITLKMNMFTLMKISLSNMLSFNMSADMMWDWMSILFLSTVLLISSLIIMFSKYYISNKNQIQFLLLLLMFVLSMSILIISNNLFLILLGWDGLGLSSYILVVYYQNFSSSASGTITLLSNRIGDILILMSMGLITISSNWTFNMNSEYSLLVLILLTTAACSKSAQFPFSAWLPMAMAAPTPISALVHSSTLVTAGVFLMLRILNPPHPVTMMMLLIISSMTAIYASMSANWEQDLKKIIALSTLSQIAMMMFSISMGFMSLAFIHLIIHALFKSAMFLCAGIMIHESAYQDMRMMGMNFNYYPLTQAMLGINSMALMGIPFMSGFFSKDMIIESMISSSMNMMMTIMMISSIGMTATYSIRMTFKSNNSSIKAFNYMSNHQSLNSIIPIIILSSMAITSGSWLSWLISPEQLFLFENSSKMIILLALFMGIMLGFSLQFKNKKFMTMGLSSISLWFLHFISILPTKPLNPIMQTFSNNDKNWQENYGPKNSFNSISLMSSTPESFKMSTLFTLMMMSLLIMFIM
uniref:NADH-ubiquinone oxidoreductase chain 5 n=1 Tax=Habronattus oregonensis TaxID=130930 RepID=Q6PYA3_HABOR|nr:NADH dehydrogenase subunit 5 [Habronattus oregonensis]AAT02495.1 NADH dehydrogenase subunit 5 [Habronattus oregonensis]